MKQLIQTSLTILLFAISGCASIRIKDIPDGHLQASIAEKSLPLGVTISESKLNQISKRSAWSSKIFTTEASATNPDYEEALKISGIKGLILAEAQEVANRNAILTKPYRELESIHHVSQQQVPKVCLALSGGGIRSASVSIGALQGLYESDQLGQTVDVVSAISGGSYALGWYAKNRINGLEDKAIFSGDSINKSVKPTLLSVSLGVLGFINSIWNGLTSGGNFAHGYDSSSLATSYETMINTAFLGGNFRDLNVSDVASITSQKRLPIPVIGIAAYPLTEKNYNAPDSNRDSDLSISEISASTKINDTYLEWSPFRFGIPGFGYSTVPLTPAWSLQSLIGLSGAALDNAHAERTARNINSGIRLGGRMALTLPNQYPIAEKPSLSTVNRALFYATDGGFVDNLGIFPLVLRGCETIVVIDAEEDPFWQFEGYGVIQQRLKNEHNLQLTVTEIDDIRNSETNSAWGAKERADGITVPKTPLDANGKKLISCKGDSFYDCPSRKKSAPLVFTGTLDRAPTSQSDIDTPKATTIIYAKLGINEESEKNGAIAKLSTSCKKQPQQCYFPHHPTFDQEKKLNSQSFEKDIFNAYVAIGNYLGREAAKHLTK
jgi:hypothetical protein